MTATTAAPASAAPAAARRPIPAAAFAHHRPFIGPAAKKYGQKALTDAYVEAVNYAFLSGWDPALIGHSVNQLSAADLRIARAPLTSAARTVFDRTFAGAKRGEAAAVRKLEQLVFFDVRAPGGLTPATDGRVVLDRKFTEPAVGLDHAHGVQRLWITFAARATIRMTDGKGHFYALPTSRTLRYWLVPNPRTGPGAVPFLFDAAAVRMTLNKPTATS